MDIELKQQIKKHLCTLKSAEDIFELFKLLNYPEENIFDTSYKRSKKDFNFKREDYDRIKNVYSVLNFEDNLPVFLLETRSLAPSFIRSISNKFDSQYMRFLLIVVDENYSEMIFILPDREKIGEGKYRLKITKLVVNKEDIKERNEYYTVIDTFAHIMYENEVNWREIWRKWKKSFNVEKVTEVFFEDYKKIFFKVRKTIQKQLISPEDAHEYTLQLLNRIMFIYFISKKGWLKYPKFMAWFWKSYKEQNKFNSNEFHEKWLNQVFFKGLNNRAYEVKDLPQNITEVINSFPYLNGGLFKKNKIDTCPVKIKDELFQKIFEFFEKYNFTIKEDMAFESEVAVDPQMIGYVYETLASLSSKDVDIYTESEKKEDEESRKKWGIFYTPIIEVDLMCRRSLVEYLAKNLPDLPKHHIYHFVFDGPNEIDETETYINDNGYWDKIENILDNLSVVDPACGSGAFLVGMLNILGELYGKIYKYTDTNLDDYQMKYRIIQRSLYGVDVMEWAVQAAELRLWLQLTIETNIKGEELKKFPLLPNLNLNLRVGDSLVQEIGGMTFNIRSNDIDYSLKKKIEELKHEKAQYFENPQRAKYKSIEDFHKQELKLFNSIIDSRIKILQDEIKQNEKHSKTKQTKLIAKTATKAENFEDKPNKKILVKIKEAKIQVQNLRKMKKTLKESNQKPFVWEIDFAEIFGDKNGFDIVIGNPPYIRHENIIPPQKNKLTVSLEDKQKYKDKLIDSVTKQFPLIKKFNGRSDYYIYFYFHGLGLLNEKGTFCFITSNSWLDVEYGKELQEFLLKYVPIIAIYDNPKRSFIHADINTVISLFGAPKFDINSNKTIFREKETVDWTMLNNITKFVMFKKPFEEVVHSTNFIKIESISNASRGHELTELVQNVDETNDYRLFPVFQEDLLEDGWNYTNPKKSKKFSSGSYGGNKWGSKYLRAPDIFYTIIKKGNKNILELEELGEVRYPIKTGINKFFYINKKNSEVKKIETEFLLPVVKSSKEFKKIIPSKDDLNFYLFSCNVSKKTLKLKNKTGALNYIIWGESQKTVARQKTPAGVPWPKVPSVKSRKNWYTIESLSTADIVCNRFIDERFFYGTFNFDVIEDQTFYGLTLKNEYKKYSFVISALLNSTISFLFTELFGRVALGEGVLQFAKYEMAKNLLYVPNLNQLNVERIESLFRELTCRDIKSIFAECGFNQEKPIREQIPNPLQDRAKIDNIIFNELGLTEAERKEVYWSLCELVKQRLNKAKKE